MKKFSETVCKALGNYVYRLVDPRNGETFYVGKGVNNRVFDHVSGALKLSEDEDEDEVGAKIKTIREIKGCGLDVIHIIHRHAIRDESIFEVEAALIDAYPGLSNEQGGHRSNDHGTVHIQQIIDKYGLEPINQEPKHKLILININNFDSAGTEENHEDVYQKVRSAWRINSDKAEKADYVLAVRRGIVIGVFEAEKGSWKPATKANFPNLVHEDSPKRKAFSGKKAPQEIWDLYCGKRGKRIDLPQLRHNQNPILYWNL